MKATRLTMLLVALAVAVSACSGGESDTTTTSAATATTGATETTIPKTTAGASGAVDDLQDVRGAIVRIVAEGSFVDPEFGQQYNAAGSGSGFFIDESGIAVTNNHVVTGAAFLQVYVEGDDDPRNARVLGVSECSDLAVIDVDGDGYPFLEWHDGDINVGMDIFAAGYPLGDEEFTLLDGIISKENADGESDWASVDSVIEHSADTLPGSSGGPIVTSDGKVVAVNYAGDAAGQSFGIGRDEALQVLPQLIEGDDVTSIGINGQALFDGAFSGIWVASVASGSPADLGGIKGGDLVTLIEGLIPATDGTMADYCDILRSHVPGDPLSVEVYRSADDAFLEGTLNTDKVLDFSYSFANALGDEVEDAGTSGPVGGYDSYVSITDAEGIINVDVPAAWNDTNLVDPWNFDGELIGVAMTAAEDIDAWYTGWETPGVFFGASTSLPAFATVDSLLDDHDFSGECVFDGRYDYEDPLYVGAYDLWVDCGGGDTLFVNLAAETPGSEVLMMVQVVVVTDADLEALDFILNSFVVDEFALADLYGTSVSTSGSSIENFANLWDGDCFNPYSTDFEDVVYGVEVEVVSCDSPHTAEVYGNYFLPDADSAPYPGADALIEIAAENCALEFENYVGSTYAESSLDYWYYYPGEAGWDSGRGFVMCALIDFAGLDLVGSAYQTGW
ncbi:MAG: S1C family serine protease [Acidimicrobiia bacterium]|nr:S1C family serine protease [Acidimicrobiia bacterium]